MKKFRLILLATLMIISSLAFAQEKPLEKVKVSGFVQGLYQVDVHDKDNIDNSFRMRRVRLAVSGDLNKVISYKIQGDFGSVPTLVDAYVKAKFCDAFAVQFGQFKLPFSIENPINPVDLEAIDYGDVINKLVGYSDVCGVGGLGRDLGLMFTGKFMKIGKDEHYLFDYSVGVFNGTGPYKFKDGKMQSSDDNKEKEFVGRLNIKPIKALTISASYYTGHYGKNALMRERYGFGAQYDDGKILARAEYIGGTTGVTIDTTFNSNGYYAVAGYWFDFKCGKNEMRLLPFLRYDHFVKDTDVKYIIDPNDKNAPYDVFTLGFNYLPYKFLSLKVNYQLINEKYIKEGTVDESEDKTRHCVKCMVSYKF